MTQTPKGKLEAFATPGKEKVLKENTSPAVKNFMAALEKGNISLKDFVINREKHLARSPELKQAYKNPEVFQYIQDLIMSIYSAGTLHYDRLPDTTKSAVEALKEHILDEMTTQNPHHEDIHKGMQVYKKKGDSGPGTVIEFDGHTATVKWENGTVEDVQKNIITKQEPAKTTTELPSDQPKPRTMVPWNNEEKVNEDPVGQQAAGNPEEEKEMRDALIKKVKEGVLKALEKEGYAITTQSGTTLQTGKDSGRGMMAAKELERSTGDPLTVVDTRTGKKTQA